MPLPISSKLPDRAFVARTRAPQKLGSIRVPEALKHVVKPLRENELSR